jgi:hypothetical protein
MARTKSEYIALTDQRRSRIRRMVLPDRAMLAQALSKAAVVQWINRKRGSASIVAWSVAWWQLLRCTAKTLLQKGTPDVSLAHGNYDISIDAGIAAEHFYAHRKRIENRTELPLQAQRTRTDDYRS